MAYRIEPLVTTSAPDRALLMAHHKGRKRFHLGKYIQSNIIIHTESGTQLPEMMTPSVFKDTWICSLCININGALPAETRPPL